MNETTKQPMTTSLFSSHFKHRKALRLGLLLILLIVSLSSAAWAYRSQAAPSAPDAPSFDVNWRTIDNGLYSASGGTFKVLGVAGQPDARSVSGGTFTVSGGYWQASMNYEHVFVPVAVR